MPTDDLEESLDDLDSVQSTSVTVGDTMVVHESQQLNSGAVVEQTLGSATLSRIESTSINVLLSIIIGLAYTVKDFFSHICKTKSQIDFASLKDKGQTDASNSIPSGTIVFEGHF